jgi:uncharacterized protein (TIGR03435 family)
MDHQEDFEEYEAMLRQLQPRKPSLPPALSPTGATWPARIAVAIAAATVFLISLGVARSFLKRLSPARSAVAPAVLTPQAPQFVRTDTERSAVVPLTDGSQVEVHSASELAIAQTPDGMRLLLTRGSVIVTAAKQRAGHFYVETRDMTVTVTGTIFFVSAEEAGSRVAVIEGQVQVQQNGVLKTLGVGKQFSTNPAMPEMPIAEEIAWSQNASTHLALLRQRAAPSPPTAKPASRAPQKIPPAATRELEFGAASIKLLSPNTAIPGYAFGIACRGTDGMQRVIVSVRFLAGEALDAHAAEVDAPQGRCNGNGIFLSTMLELAYGLQPRFVSGFPDWARQTGGSPSIFENGAIRFPGSGAFQIEAVADDRATATVEQLKQMLRAMLATRFSLQVHREKRESRGYALLIAKTGPKLKEVSGEPVGVVTLEKEKTTIPQLITRLMNLVDAPIIDRTDLKGVYEYQLRIPPRGGQRGTPPGQAPDLTDRAAEISAALESQLGLLLQPEKSVPFDFLVIGHAEMPSPN